MACLNTQAQSDYLFSYLGMQQGLAGEYVRQVQQDKAGYIWVSTRSCLQRYDGIRFLNLYTGKGILPQGFIREMLIDKQNRLWICFENNTIGYLNPSTFKWQQVQFEPGDGIKARDPHFFESNDGKIIFACTGENILTFNEIKKTFSIIDNPFQMPEGWKFISIWQDANNNYWASTYGGLVKYNPATKLISYKNHNAESDSYITLTADLTMIQNFFIDKRGTGWITTWPLKTGLSFKSIDTKNKKLKEWTPEIYNGLHWEYYTILKMQETKEQRWLYGENLLATFDNATDSLQLISKTLPGKWSIYYDAINYIYEDREHNLWISTNKGLYYYRPASKYLKSFNNYTTSNKLAHTVEVTDILKTKNGEVWVSTWGGNGIYTYDTAFNPIRSDMLKNSNPSAKTAMIWSVTQMKNGDIWWGAQDGWLSKYDAAKKNINSFQPELAKGITIRQVESDTEDNLWLGLQGGRIIKYSCATNEWKLVCKARSNINRLIVSKNNEVWAATDFDGVYRIQASSGKMISHYTDTLPEGKKLFSAGALELLEYNDSIMLVVSAGLNVINLRTDSIQNKYEQFEIFNLEKDSTGLIWASTNLGLIAITLDHDKPALKFDQRDGLNNLSFSGAAVSNLSNGTIVFGNNHGFVAFNPEKLKHDAAKNEFTKIQIAEVYVNDKYLNADSILQQKKLKVGTGNFSIKIRYTTNTFKAPLPLYYMLEEIDKTWKEVSDAGEITLNYLLPGKYVLKVCTKNDSNEIISISELPIDIEPKFYQTEWFYILIALFALAIVYLLDYSRMKRKEYVQQLRRNIARQLHEEVSSTLEKVNILSDIAIMKHEADPVKSREFIAEIKLRSSAMVSAMQDMLWAIAPENDSMKELVGRFKKYIQVTNNRHNTQINFAADEKVIKLKLNMQIRYELLLLFKRSIKSLMKASVKDLQIYTGCENRVLYFMFQFVNEKEDSKNINNFLSGKDLNDKLKSLQGEITTTVKSQITEILIKVNL